MALFAAGKIVAGLSNGLIVIILPDSGRNYLTKFYNDEWMIQQGFFTKEENEI